MKEETRGGNRPGAGRPKGSGKFHIGISLLITNEMNDKLEAITDAEGLSRAEVIRRIIENHLR